MKTKAIFLLTFIITSISLTPQAVFSQNSSDSANVNIKVIKENVKKRIQDVVNVKGETNIIKKPVAFTGKLLSLANKTLTVETNEGVKLASISAQTTYAKMPGSKPAELSDISIDDYLTVLGFINGNQVLDTRRVITQKLTPPLPSQQTSFGKLLSYDPSNNTFTIQTSSTEDPVSLYYGNKSDINVQLSLDQKIPFEVDDELPPDSLALVIYNTPDEGEDIYIDLMLIKQSLSPTDNNNPTRSSTNSATISTPPELRL